MEDSVSRAIMFGVGIFITLIITSGVIGIFSQMKNIYADVDKTNTTITSRFGEFARYDNTTLTGMDVINTANRFYNDNLVTVVVSSVEVNTEAGLQYLNGLYDSGVIKYEDKFTSTQEEVTINGFLKTQITLTKI